MDRREFLVFAAGACAGAALMAGFTLPLPRQPGDVASSSAPPRAIGFLGARHWSGPAPSGLPYVPLTVEEGVLAVRPRVAWNGAEVDALAWHRYCGLQDAPGLDPSWRGTNKISYHDPYRDSADRRMAPVWWADRHGEFVRPEDVPPGEALLFRWRSAADDPRPLLGVLLHVGAKSLRHEHAPPDDAGQRPGEVFLTEAEFDAARRALFRGDLVATSAVCTHFACVVGYNDPNARSLAQTRNAGDLALCACHVSKFDLRCPMGYAASDPEALRAAAVPDAVTPPSA